MGFTVGVRLGFGVGADEVGLAVGLGLGAAPSTSASMPTVNSTVNSDSGVMAKPYRIFIYNRPLDLHTSKQQASELLVEKERYRASDRG